MEIKYSHPSINKFLDSLDVATRARVNKTIYLLSAKTYQLTMPDSKRLEKDLYELRIQSVSAVRIFYTFYKDQIFLLHAINKKSQRLKEPDLNTARQRLKFLRSL